GRPGGTSQNAASPITHPRYEVVHLFDFEALDFGLPDDEPLVIKAMQIADVGQFAPVNVTPVDGLFTKKPPAELLMRTVLRGGEINSAAPDDPWVFDSLFSPGFNYKGQFVGTMTWTRKVKAADLTLRVKEWDGTEKVALHLKPRSPGGTVSL